MAANYPNIFEKQTSYFSGTNTYLKPNLKRYLDSYGGVCYFGITEDDDKSATKTAGLLNLLSKNHKPETLNLSNLSLNVI